MIISDTCSIFVMTIYNAFCLGAGKSAAQDKALK